jgi:hypothetical protein
METLHQRLSRERAKDPEHAPLARLSRGVGSETIHDRAVNIVADGLQRGPVLVRESTETKAPTLPIRDPSQHTFSPPGYGMGIGPTPKGALIGTQTTLQAMLDKRHADLAHGERATPDIAKPEGIAKEASAIHSDMRPTIGRPSGTLFTQFDRGDDERGGR